MPRVLVAWVPCRRAASSAITTSWTSGPLNGCSKTSASSATGLRAGPSVGASGIGPHLHGLTLRARHGAAHEHQVAIGHELDDRQALLRGALGTHVARAADALEHARRRGRGADRARRALVVRAVGLGARGEVVTLDRALEALALADAGDLDGLTDLEGLDRHGVADHELARLVAELHERLHGRRVDLLEVTEQRLVERFLAHGTEAELYSFIAVGVVGADGGDRARTRFQDRDTLDTAVVEEALGHAELLGEDGGHLGSDDRGGAEGMYAVHQLKASRI